MEGFEGYDVIGDVHGHADRLEALLRAMGYADRDGAFRHPSRQAIFVGDLVDRGPGQLETVRIARSMVDAGSARIVLGNHEFNALAYATEDPDSPGHHLRPHHGEKGAKNVRQHEAFIGAVGGLHTSAHLEVLDWFRTIPLWLDLGDLRVVHACWHQPSIDLLEPLTGPGGSITDDLLVAASRKGSEEYEAVEVVLKGPEVSLGDGRGYFDKDGHPRTRARTRWWLAGATTLRDLALVPDGVERFGDWPDGVLPADPVPEHELITYDGDVPVVVGHYWASGTPSMWHGKVACVDYSVAKGGQMVAYRWSGEPLLTDTHFVAA